MNGHIHDRISSVHCWENLPLSLIVNQFNCQKHRLQVYIGQKKSTCRHQKTRVVSCMSGMLWAFLVQGALSYNSPGKGKATKLYCWIYKKVKDQLVFFAPAVMSR